MRLHPQVALILSILLTPILAHPASSPSDQKCKPLPYPSLISYLSDSTQIQKGPNGFYIPGSWGQCYTLDISGLEAQLEMSQLWRLYLRGLKGLGADGDGEEGEVGGKLEVREGLGLGKREEEKGWFL